ncbi:MAG: hypothetical protein ABIH39_02980, partial [Candidatus Margulisiibacteriota bacterium]
MGARILLVGCGQLGSRHLQSISVLNEIETIEIAELNPASIQLGRERMEQVADRNKNIEYKWLNELSWASVHGDLCIIATTAGGRGKLIRKIA